VRIECVEAFADAAVRVLSAVLDEECGRGPLRLADTGVPGGGIAVLVRFRGEFAGYAVLRLDASAAATLSRRAVGDQEGHDPDLVLDYVLELGNMIAGGAVGSLNDGGFDIVVDPPQLHNTDGLTVPAEACQIPVYSPHGTILVQVVQNAW